MILQTENLMKKYKSREVLHDLSLTVNEGEVYAILGKNGAGKSTFIKIVLGFIFNSGGKITVYDDKPGVNNHRIGYLSENITLYPHLSAVDNLKVAAYSANVKLDKKRIEEILERVSLTDTFNKQSKDFSLGMKRRLQLAMAAMIKKVDFLILDEPTNGLDVAGLIWLKSYLKQLKNEGVSILLASHSITDLQECITDYVIFNKGTAAKIGKWNNENEITKGFKIEIKGPQKESTLNLFKEKNITVESYDEKSITIYTDIQYKNLCEILYDNKIIPDNITAIKSSLESLFISCVGEK